MSEIKIPFENSKFGTITLDLEFFKSKEYQELPHELNCSPSTIVLNQNNLALINIIIKPAPG